MFSQMRKGAAAAVMASALAAMAPPANAALGRYSETSNTSAAPQGTFTLLQSADANNGAGPDLKIISSMTGSIFSPVGTPEHGTLSLAALGGLLLLARKPRAESETTRLQAKAPN